MKRILRYTGVNLVTVTLDYAVFLTLTHFTGAPATSSVIAYMIALVWNYDLSKRFVFGSDGQHKSQHRLFIEFALTGLLGLVLTWAITGLGVHQLGWKPVKAKTIAVLICFVALYIVRSRLVFTPRVE
jgi:putative flippase GtrA